MSNEYSRASQLGMRLEYRHWNSGFRVLVMASAWQKGLGWLENVIFRASEVVFAQAKRHDGEKAKLDQPNRSSNEPRSCRTK